MNGDETSALLIVGLFCTPPPSIDRCPSFRQQYSIDAKVALT